MEFRKVFGSLALRGVVCVALAAVVLMGWSAAAQEARLEHPPVVPQQEVVDHEEVQIFIDYQAQTITVSPETVQITFQWDPQRQDPLKATQARWVVRGLAKDHHLYLVAKEGNVDGVFAFPDSFRGRAAFRIDGTKNAIATGRVLELPELEPGKGYTSWARSQAVETGEPYVVSWTYDVVVTDASGEVVLEVDPEIVINAHP